MHTYGISFLTITSPEQTFTEPVSVAEVKSFLNLPESSASDPPNDLDSQIASDLSGMIQAAREWAEAENCKPLVTAQYDTYLDVFPPQEVGLLRPVKTVDLVRTTDCNGDTDTLVETTDYIVDKERGLLMPPYGSSWPSFTPWPSSAVLIRYTVDGARNVTHVIKRGILLLISHWYCNRLPFHMTTQSGVSAEYAKAVSDCFAFGARPRMY